MAGLRMRVGERTVGVDGLEGEGPGAGGEVMVVNMVKDAHVGDEERRVYGRVRGGTKMYVSARRMFS